MARAGSVIGLKAKLGIETDDKQVEKETDRLRDKIEEAAEAEMETDVDSLTTDIRTGIEDTLSDISGFDRIFDDPDTVENMFDESSTKTVQDRIQAAEGTDVSGSTMGRPSVGPSGQQRSGSLGGEALQGLKGAGGSFLKVGLAGAVGFGILGALTGLSDAAPRFQKTLDLLYRSVKLFIRPFLDTIARFFEGPVMQLVQMATQFNQIYNEDGLLVALSGTGEEFVNPDDGGMARGIPRTLGSLGGAVGGAKIASRFLGGRGKLVGAGLGGLLGFSGGDKVGKGLSSLLSGDINPASVTSGAIAAGGTALGVGKLRQATGPFRAIPGKVSQSIGRAGKTLKYGYRKGGIKGALKAGGSILGRGGGGMLSGLSSKLGIQGLRSMGIKGGLRGLSKLALGGGPAGWGLAGIMEGGLSLADIAGGGEGGYLGAIPKALGEKMGGDSGVGKHIQNAFQEGGLFGPARKAGRVVGNGNVDWNQMQSRLIGGLGTLGRNFSTGGLSMSAFESFGEIDWDGIGDSFDFEMPDLIRDWDGWGEYIEDSLSFPDFDFEGWDNILGNVNLGDMMPDFQWQGWDKILDTDLNLPNFEWQGWDSLFDYNLNLPNFQWNGWDSIFGDIDLGRLLPDFNFDGWNSIFSGTFLSLPDFDWGGWDTILDPNINWPNINWNGWDNIIEPDIDWPEVDAPDWGDIFGGVNLTSVDGVDGDSKGTVETAISWRGDDGDGDSKGTVEKSVSWLGAEGGVVTGPTNALIGEGTENEAVMPLSRLEQTLDRERMRGAEDVEASVSEVKAVPTGDGGGGGLVEKVANNVTDKIPGLAEGGIVSTPTTAMVGEGSESEAVMPLSKLEQTLNRERMKGAEEVKSSVPEVRERMRGERLVAASVPEVRERTRDAEEIKTNVPEMRAVPTGGGGARDAEEGEASVPEVRAVPTSGGGTQGAEEKLDTITSTLEQMHADQQEEDLTEGTDVDMSTVEEHLSSIRDELKSLDKKIELNMDGKTVAKEVKRQNQRYSNSRVVSR